VNSMKSIIKTRAFDALKKALMVSLGLALIIGINIRVH